MKYNPDQYLVFFLAAGLLAGCGMDPPEEPERVEAPSADASVVNQVKSTGLVGASLVAVPGPYQQMSSNSNDCNLEGVAGKSIELASTEVVRGNSIQVNGWYIDAPAGTNGEPLKIVIEAQDLSGRWASTVDVRSERADVDQAKNGDGKFTMSGVVASLDMTALPAGSYGIYFNGSAGLCSVGRVFTLK